jgi:hypothetical protein
MWGWSAGTGNRVRSWFSRGSIVAGRDVFYNSQPPWRPDLVLPPESGEDERRFIFTARRTALLGRGTEMAALEDFIGHRDRFRWWLMAGPGGMGKSRLALELCRQLRPPEARDGWDWGFLGLPGAAAQRASADMAGWKAWQPDRPTLIVADYVVERAAVLGEVVRCLAQRRDLAHPVRLLLLEREAAGQWLQAFMGADAPGQAITDAARHQEPLTLAAPGDDALWGIVATMAGDKAGTRAERLDQLRAIDPAGRPLFAAFFGDALAHAGHPRLWDRKALLGNVLERERRHFWAAAAVTVKDEALLCLATLTGGAWDAWLEAPALADVRDDLPCLDDRDLERRYTVMAGAPETRSENPLKPMTLFGPLQPDLLGEFFVLQHLSHGVAGAHRTRRIAAWSRAAWRLDYLGAAVFLDRLMQDFANDPALPLFLDEPALDPPMPDDAQARLGWAMLTVNSVNRLGAYALPLAQEFYRKLAALAAGHADQPALREQQAKAAFNLIDELGSRNEVEEARGLYDELAALAAGPPGQPALREVQAKAAFNLINHLGSRDEVEAARVLYKELVALAADHPDEPALREEQATAALNLICKLVSQDVGAARVLYKELVALAAKHADPPLLGEALERARKLLDFFAARHSVGTAAAEVSP